MKKVFIISVLFTCFTFNGFAQTGPAGVGNATGASGQPENIIWLDAGTLGLSDGDPVLTWSDLSGNGNNLVQLGADATPLFETNGLFSGNHAAVRFDGTERYLSLADNADLDNSLSGITMISVVYNAVLDGNARGIYSKRNSSSSEESYGVFTYTAGRVNFDIRNTGDNRLASTASLNTSTDYIISTVYSGSLMEIFLQSGASGTLSTSGNINNSTSNLILGALNENYGDYFNGDIAELIFYRGALNDAQRIIVENYLSQKYDITIGNDFFSAGDASFKNDLQGIGTSDGAEKFTQSGFSDALQLSELNGSLNNVNEFVLFAHDNTPHAQGLTTDITVDPGVLDSHWARSWYVENSGDVSVELRFDFGDAGLAFSGDPTDYVLLYRPNTSSNYTRALVNSYAVENTDQLVIDASNSNLPSGYYTIGQGEQLVPGDIYSYQSGDWNDPLTWTTDPSGALRTPAGGLIPASDDNVTILSGRTVTMDSDDNDGINLTVNGELVIASTSGHDYFNILGNGVISIAGDASNNDNFPSGSTTVFADSIVGGTVEIIGGAINLNQNRTYNNVLVNLNNTSDLATLLADYLINGDLTIDRGTLRFNDNSATISRNITVYGDTQINGSGELAVGTANARHEFNFYGDFNNSGRAEFTNRISTDYNNEAANGIVDANFLSPLANQEINCNGITNFYRIEIDKGTDQTYILDINATSAANFNLYGPADYGHGSVAQLTTNDNALGLLRGTVRLNTNVDVPVLNNGGNYNISEAARLWVNGGSAEKPSGTAIVPYGTLQLSGGVLNAPINSGITSRENGNIIVSDGVMTVNQIRTSVNGPENIGGYTQSGGTVNVTGGTVEQDYYTFSLTYPGNTFNMSGGVLNVQGASDRGLIFINSDPGNVSITGGTVNAISSNTKISKISSRAPFWNLNISNSINSTNTNARVAVTTGSSGSGANESNVINPDLIILQDLTIQTGTLRNDGTSIYGGYLDLCYDYNNDGIDDCVNVEIASDFTIQDNAVFDVFSSEADNANSSTLTFNSSTFGLFYIGDITDLDYTLTEYEDPDNPTSNPYQDYRLPIYNLVVDKNGGTLRLAAKNPGLEDTGNPLTSGGGKNLDSNEARLLYIRDGLTIASGSTLNQIDPIGSGAFGYIVRAYADEIIVDGNLLVYEQGVNPTNSFLEIREIDPDGDPNTDVGDVININSTEGSTIGNLVCDLGNDELSISSDLYVKRFVYRHGGVNLGTHNLKVDILDMNTESAGDNRRLRSGNGEYLLGENTAGARQYFYTAGNASDGGLSIKMPRVTNLGGADDTQNIGFDPAYDNENDEYQNTNLLWFPIGVSDRYTPAVMYIVNDGSVTYSGDEYVTVRPVDGELRTTDNSGGDLLSYYWRIGHDGFDGGLPTVSWLFQYDQDDIEGNEANYVPGKVLDGDTYQRSWDGSAQAVKNANTAGNGSTNDDDENGNILGNDPGNIIIFNGLNTGTAGTPGNVGDDNIDAGTNNEIFFNGTIRGQWDPQFPNVGFTLENANYTAGEADRFVGAPQVLYNTNVGRRNWNDGTKWTTNTDGSDDGVNAFPGPGDIAIMQNYGDGNQNAWVNANIDLDIAQLIFSDENGGWIPRLWVTDRTANLNLGTVEGVGSFYLEVTATQVPTFSNETDLGLYAAEQNSYFIYKVDSDNQLVDMISNIDTYPNLRIEGGNGNNDDDNRILQTTIPITVNGDVRMDRSCRFRANHDITILNDLRITWQENRCTFEIGDDREVTINVVNNLRLEDGSGNDNSRILVKNDNQNSYEHRIIVSGDVEIEGINAGSSAFDLYNGVAPNNNAILEFGGDSNAQFINASSITPDLYRVVVSKSGGKSNTVEVTTDFDLNGTTNGVGVVKAIELQSGILRLNNAGLTLDLTTGDDSFSIPSGAGLQLTQGLYTVSGNNSGIALDGCLIIDGGTLDMDDAVGNGNNFIEYSASGNAELEISVGSLIVGSQIRPITTANTGVLKYTQTGGDVRIGTQAAPTGTRGMLQIYNAGSEFNFTGGTLTIERHQTSPSISALYLDPDESNVTAEITIFNANTPAGQNDFRINSFIPLSDLTINGTNNPSASIRTSPLVIDGQLTINTGATLNGNGVTLTVNGDFENNGAYDAQNNETIFNTDLTHEIRGSGTNNFFRFTKSGTGSLELTNAVTINGLFTIGDGTLNDNGFDIILNADAVINGSHSSSGGNGLIFSGSANQELRRTSSGTSTIGGVRINNTNGVTIPDGNGYNFNINADLQLNGGVFDVGGSNILLGENSDIIAVQPFSVSNMIRTNSSFVDKGVGKTFTANTTTDFTFPLGQAYYTPIVFDLSSNSNTSGSTTGTIFVSPANEYHPTIDDGNDVTAGGDINNVLQYYWTLTAENITGFTSDVTFGYNDALVEAVNGSEADYIAARILAFDNPMNNINKFTTAEVNEAANLILFTFAGDASNGITGDYFAGIDQAIPNNVATYIVDTNGNFDSDVYDQAVPGGGAPTGSVVVVPNGFTLTLNQSDANFYRTEIQAGGVLEVADGTSNHRLGILEGTGDLRIVSNGINANLPAFSGDFLSCTGGGLEYAGTGSYNVLGGITSVRNLTFSGSGIRNFPNNNVTVCEDLVLDGPTVNNSNNRNITIERNLIINSGILNAGTGNLTVDGNFELNGGLFDNNNGGTTSVFGDIDLQAGTFNVSSGGLINSYGDINNTGATFNGGSSSARVNLFGNSQQTISGDFTGSNSFSRLLVNNNQGALLESDIEVTNALFLTNGIISTGSNNLEVGIFGSINPSIGKANSFVDGKLSKTIAVAGQSFTFPIGDAGRWRPVSLNNVSAGGITWEAEFVAGDASSEPAVDNFDLTNPGQIATIQKNEYWKISDGNIGSSGVTATVGLSWGTESDVSAVFAEREQLQVMAWNDGISSWDNLGGTGFSSGHTQSAGSFRATTSSSFSERIFTLGSSDASNPLPVELVSFTGKIQGSATRLEWKTSSELNNDYFEIEHSTDGVIFETLSRVEGAGTTTVSKDYVLYHERPIDGFNYYRLKQVDYDGTATYKGVVNVYKEGEVVTLDFVPFPNPTTQDNINLNVKANRGPVVVDVIDGMGISLFRSLYEVDEISNEEIKLNLDTRLSKGIYIIRLTQGGKSVAKRVMIKE